MKQAETRADRERIKDAGEMNIRRVTLADGRYIIFYTFDGAPTVSDGAGDQAKQREPDAQPVATEEHNV